MEEGQTMRRKGCGNKNRAVTLSGRTESKPSGVQGEECKATTETEGKEGEGCFREIKRVRKRDRARQR